MGEGTEGTHGGLVYGDAPLARGWREPITMTAGSSGSAKCAPAADTHYFIAGARVCLCGQLRAWMALSPEDSTMSERHGRPHDARMAEDHDAHLRDPVGWPVALGLTLIALALLVWRLGQGR